jgi:hypothetical protein
MKILLRKANAENDEPRVPWGTRGFGARAKPAVHPCSAWLEWCDDLPKIAALGPRSRSAEDFELPSRHFAGALVGHEFERDLLAFAEIVQAGLLNSADVNEGVLAAVIRLNEAVAFFVIEPLHSSVGHVLVFPYLDSACLQGFVIESIFAGRPIRNGEASILRNKNNDSG